MCLTSLPQASRRPDFARERNYSKKVKPLVLEYHDLKYSWVKSEYDNASLLVQYSRYAYSVILELG